MQLQTLAAVKAGGALGAGARYLPSSQVARLLGSGGLQLCLWPTRGLA